MNTPTTQSPDTHSDAVLRIAVRNLRVGQRVNLEGDDVADPDYVASDGVKSAHPEFAYEYETVGSIEHESDECTVVYFSGFTCAFPPDHEVEVDPEQTFDAPNWPGSPDPANPDNAWIDDATGESVDAFGVRTQLYYECAICGAFHRLNFTGDCREDSERFDDVPPESVRRENGDPVPADDASTEWLDNPTGDVQSSIDYTDERKQAVEDAVEAALNAGCKAIQDRLGVTSGDLAGMHFSGDDASDPLREVFGAYFDAELDRGANRV